MLPRPLRCHLIVLLFCLAGSALAGLPNDVFRAQQLYDAPQFEAAAQAVIAALGRPGRGPEEWAVLYRLRGLLHAARDDNARTQADFLRWLALDPAGQWPPGVAPKIVAPFLAAAREQRRQERLALRPTLLPDRLHVELRCDRARLGQAVLVRYAVYDAAGVLRADVPAQEPQLVELSLASLPLGPLRYTVALLGEHGGRLAQVGDLAAPLTGRIGCELLWRSPWLWAALGGAMAAGLGLRR